MATEQYFQTNFIKDNKTTSEKWKSSSEAIDDSESTPCSGFDCNICLDSVQDPVVTLCGHLYCWPCIYKWIHHQTEKPNKHNPQCPVCKQAISHKTMVPLYGRDQPTKPQSDKKEMVIPARRPFSSVPTEQVNYRGYQQQTQNAINPTSPTTGMLGEIVFGNTQIYRYPNSYNVVTISTQRARRHAIQADRSLGRLWFFLFCCIMLCLILF